MERDGFLAMLDTYGRRWKDEAATVGRFRGFVSSQPRCFERGLKVGHVTASAWLVNEAGTHVLLTHHRKLNRWLQLGGHADGDPDVRRVAVREAGEESGLRNVVPLGGGIFDVDIHRIPEHRDEEAHDHFDVRFAMMALGDGDCVVSRESYELRWREIAGFNALTVDESLLRLARKWERDGASLRNGRIG